MAAPTRPALERKYLVTGKRFPSQGSATPGRVYFYLFRFNVRGAKNHHPFFVGYTESLVRRLSNHSRLTWHASAVGEPALVEMVGMLKTKYAEDAEADLIKRLADHSLLLAHPPHHKGEVGERFGIDNLAKATASELSPYLNAPISEGRVVEQWLEYWKRVESRGGSAPVPLEKALAKITREDAVRFFSKTTLATRESTLLTRLLASAYVAEEKCATVTFAEVPRNSEREIARVEKMISGMDSMWYTGAKVKLGKPIRFFLSKRACDRILENT